MPIRVLSWLKYFSCEFVAKIFSWQTKTPQSHKDTKIHKESYLCFIETKKIFRVISCDSVAKNLFVFILIANA